MKTMSSRMFVQLIVAVALLAGSGLAHAGDAAPAADKGLELTKAKGIDELYKRPGASLAAYRQVLLRPIDVSFAKSWNPRDFGTFGLSTSEVAKIRNDLSLLAQETFTRTLTAGGYAIVTSPGEGVLEVNARLVDLYVNAPDTNSAGRSRTYVMNAGEMRLITELKDSVTGATLYWARDRKRGTETGRMQWANSVFNRAEAESALRGWANQLKQALDAAKQN